MCHAHVRIPARFLLCWTDYAIFVSNHCRSSQAAEHREATTRASVGEWQISPQMASCFSAGKQISHQDLFDGSCGQAIFDFISTNESSPSSCLIQLFVKIKAILILIYVFLFPGLQEVVVVVQSQRNSYHARRGEQRKAEILQQAANLGKVNQSEMCPALFHAAGSRNHYESELRNLFSPLCPDVM